MKQFKFVIPTSLDTEFAKYCFENSIRLLLSYTVGGDFFDSPKVCVIVATEEANVAALDKYSSYKKS